MNFFVFKEMNFATNYDQVSHNKKHLVQDIVSGRNPFLGFKVQNLLQSNKKLNNRVLTLLQKNLITKSLFITKNFSLVTIN